MAKHTKIQWCDSTVNPTLGCDTCELWTDKRKTCYAGKLTRRFGGTNPGFASVFEQVSTAPGRMAESAKWSVLTDTTRPNKPWLDGLPRLIFVSDMSDALSQKVRFDYLRKEIIDNVVSDDGVRHQWLWLTKRPGRMRLFSDWLGRRGVEWPRNLGAGTSITTQKTTWRIDSLLQVGNSETIRFLSVEPQWEEIDLRSWLPDLDWVLQGGESGRGAKPFHVEWAEDVRNQCRDHRVPYFLKQLGSHVLLRGERLKLKNGHGGDWSEWPVKIRCRMVPINGGGIRLRRIGQRQSA